MDINNHIVLILIDRRRHSSVPDICSFRAEDCDTDNYLVVARVRETVAVNKQRSHRFHMERFNLKNLNEVEVKKRSIALKSQIGLQLWKIWTLRWK
jgi:hypothetical protein